MLTLGVRRARCRALGALLLLCALAVEAAPAAQPGLGGGQVIYNGEGVVLAPAVVLEAPTLATTTADSPAACAAACRAFNDTGGDCVYFEHCDSEVGAAAWTGARAGDGSSRPATALRP